MLLRFRSVISIVIVVTGTDGPGQAAAQQRLTSLFSMAAIARSPQ